MKTPAGRAGVPTTPVSERRAAALAYDGAGTLPRVVASGKGREADAVVAAARRHGVPVVRDAAAAAALAAVPEGGAVPEESLRLVAEILGFLYRADLAWRRSKGIHDSMNQGPEDRGPANPRPVPPAAEPLRPDTPPFPGPPVGPSTSGHHAGKPENALEQGVYEGGE